MKRDIVYGIIKGFKYAISGIKLVIVSETNFRIHLVVFFYTISLSIISGITYIEYIVIFLVSAMVLSLEMINTAIERLCDRVCMDYDDSIRVVKDILAGCVLVSCIFSVVIGISIFSRKIDIILGFFRENPTSLILCIFCLIPSLIFIKGARK